MKLGVKYISLWKDGSLFTTKCNSTDTPHGIISDKPDDDDPWLAVDLDALPNATTIAAIERGDATDAQRDEYAQHHERNWIHHYAALQAVRPDANPEDAVARELVRLRGECERMRRLCNLAVEWQRGDTGNRDDIDAWSKLYDAIEQYRSHAQPQPRAGATLTDATEQLIRAAVAWRVTRCERLAGCDYGDHDVQCPISAIERALSDAAMPFIDGDRP